MDKRSYNYSYDDYTIGWMTILTVENTAAYLMFDEVHPRLDAIDNDDNFYTLGRIGRHNVVLMSPSRAGTEAASHAATNMARTFKKIRFVFLIGVGGGAPLAPVGEDSDKHDLMLGDVVVSFQENERDRGYGYVMQHDCGKHLGSGELEIRSYVRKPQAEIINAIRGWKMEHMRNSTNLERYLLESVEKAKKLKKREYKAYKFPGRENDKLYAAEDLSISSRPPNEHCQNRSLPLVTRLQREDNNPVVHYGLIASGNSVMGDGRKRDELRDKFGVMCFEMEAAGLMNEFPCLVLRGISDYSDNHKNDDWKPWASMTASAAAKDLLSVIQPRAVNMAKTIIEIIGSEVIPVVNEIRSGVEKGNCRSGEWLRDEESFQNWLEEDPLSRVLWVHGKHGVGKSVLCAMTIQHMINKHGESSVIYAFIHQSQQVPARCILLHLASQLLNTIQLPSDATEVPEYLKDFLEIDGFDIMMVKKFLVTLLTHRPDIPTTYIFIDGLDERDYFDSAQGTEGRSNKQENDFLISTLVRIATTATNPNSVRLWFSSQETVDIREIFENFGVNTIEVTTKKTLKDIKRYLNSARPETLRHIDYSETSSLALEDSIDSIFPEVTVPLSDMTFLWAHSVYQEIEEVRDGREIREIFNSVPRDINGRYEMIIDQIKRKPLQTASTRSPWPIWQIVLSMLVFAKRPLHLLELMEGVAILRNRTNHQQNIRSEDLPNRWDVLKSCMSFIYLLRDDQEAQCCDCQTEVNCLVVLSHGAVRKFLIERSDICGKYLNSGGLISSKIIGRCCVQHLLQPKFADFLYRVDDKSAGRLTTIERGFREIMSPDSLLFYAAKYWHEHFDTGHDREVLNGKKDSTPKKPAAEDLDTITKFLQSSNFLTCIQVQSLYVEGHFFQSYDSLTDLVDSVKRTLPNWVCRLSADNLGPTLSGIYCQLKKFLSEWGELLEVGPSIQAYGNGPMDRCLWQTLGEKNFLSQQSSRYSHMVLQKNGCSGLNAICGTKIERLPPGINGENFVSIALCMCVSRNVCEVSVDTLGIQGPDVAAEFNSEVSGTAKNKDSFRFTDEAKKALFNLDLSQSQSNIDYYGRWASGHFPIIPNYRCIPPPDTITVFEEESLIRVGSIFFNMPIIESSNGAIELEKAEGGICIDLWEDVRSRGRYSVASRRRTFIRKRLPLGSDRSESLFDSDREFDRNSSVSSGDESWRYEEALSSDRDAGQIAYLDSEEEESWLDRRNDLLDDDTLEDMYSMLSEAGYSDNEFESELGCDVADHLSISYTCTSDGFDSDEEYRTRNTIPNKFRTSDTPDYQELEGLPKNYFDKKLIAPIVFSNRRFRVQDCERKRYSCKERCDEMLHDNYYYCPACSSEISDESYTICYKCEERGRWCLNRDHQLYDMRHGKAVTVIANNHFTAHNRIAVFDKAASIPKLLFTFQQKPSQVLYDSYPAIHPSQPLIAWPLNGKEILLANFETRAWRKQDIEIEGKEAVPICVDVSFSSCGTLLRVAKVEGVKRIVQQSKNADTDEGVLDEAKQLSLNLHVVMIEVSPPKPIAVPPKPVCITSVNLGFCERYLIKTSPFTFTWSDDKLYVSVSSSRLRVYQVGILRSPNINTPTSTAEIGGGEPQDPDCGTQYNLGTVKTLKEIIFLPRSARNRKVQYLPPKKAGDPSTVIIGPQPNGSQPASIVLSLTEEDIGGWLSLKEKDLAGEVLLNPRLQRKGMYEEFDVTEDCDFVPISDDRW
ncbi:hypothetical protein TWF103_009611 [Orbilia oligospora]|nr:hypothetical protein TWF103_009611 [Orbilia oligospora]